MKDRHSHGSIGEGCQIADCPMSGVAPADSYFVTFPDATILEKYMDFLYLACDIVKLERNTLIVRQRILIPVIYDGLLNVSIKTAKLVHENCTFNEILCKGSANFAHLQKKCAIFYALW